MIRFALCLSLALLTCGCQVALTSHMPSDLDLDPIWFDYAPPLTVAERGIAPEVVADLVPADIPPDPLAGIAPDGTRGSELDPLRYAPGPRGPATPAVPGEPAPVRVPDPVVAVIPEGVNPEDPFEDMPAGPVPVSLPTAPVPLPAAPDKPVSAPAVGPAADSNDLDAPPGGGASSPLPPAGVRPIVPPVRVEKTDVPDPFAPSAQPRERALPTPPPVAPTPLPAGTSARPVEDDPFGSAPRPRGPTLPAPSLPDPVSTPGLPVPTDPEPAPRAPDDRAEVGGDDPFAGTQAGPRFSSSDPGERAQEQATRLFDDPGNPRIQGYPRGVLMLSDAWVALRPGPRPVVVVFYDDARRASDLMAGEILPVLAAHQREIDVVAINRGAGAKPDKYESALVRQLLEGAEDTVPVLVVQDANRKLLLARFTRFPGSELERVLSTGRAMGTGPRAVPATLPEPTGVGETPRRPDPLFGPEPAQPVRPTTPRASIDPNLPPAGLLSNPLGAPARAHAPFGDSPRAAAPDRAAPALPVRPSGVDPLAPAGAGPERASPVFSTPDRQAAERHAARLRENPGQSQLGGYPRSLLPGSRPEVALQPGHRPVVIVFFDNASRASNLQAADVLPVLVAAQATADVITIDVAKGAQRTASESKVVKPYYPGSVPAIVVLSPARAPVKLWFQRTSARALRAAIEQATRVR